MELAFENKYIRCLCEDEDKAEEELGLEIAAKLKSRLSDMRAASVVTELPPTGSPIEVAGNPHPNYRIKLFNNYYLTFCSNHIKLPINEKGDLDWSKVSHVKILDINQINETNK